MCDFHDLRRLHRLGDGQGLENRSNRDPAALSVPRRRQPHAGDAPAMPVRGASGARRKDMLRSHRVALAAITLFVTACGGGGSSSSSDNNFLSKALQAAKVQSSRSLRDEVPCIECGETSFFTGVAGDRLAYRCLAGHAVTLTVEAAVKAGAARRERPPEDEGDDAEG